MNHQVLMGEGLENEEFITLISNEIYITTTKLASLKDSIEGRKTLKTDEINEFYDILDEMYIRTERMQRELYEFSYVLQKRIKLTKS